MGNEKDIILLPMASSLAFRARLSAMMHPVSLWSKIFSWALSHRIGPGDQLQIITILPSGVSDHREKQASIGLQMVSSPGIKEVVKMQNHENDVSTK